MNEGRKMGLLRDRGIKKLEAKAIVTERAGMHV
jgi:hypothetical protein